MWKKIIIVYCVIALALQTGLNLPMVDSNVQDYDYVTLEVSYDRSYYEDFRTSNTESFSRFQGICKAISKFGDFELFLNIDTGWKSLNKLVNFFVLPINFMYNIGQLVYDIFGVILNTDFDNTTGDNTTTYYFYQGDFSSGSSYGGSGGSVHGGR